MALVSATEGFTARMSMRAIAVNAPGPDYELVPCDLDVPEPGPDQVLIKVAAAAVNRADLLQAAGKYPPPPGACETLGLEVSGHVVAGGLPHGTPVCALLTGGGYADFALADAGSILPLPAGIALADAAALPEALFTAWTNLVEAGGMQAGDTVLVHGGGSGIGTAAIQLAKALGATVLTTAGGTERCQKCRALGAARAIDHYTEDFVAAVQTATTGRGADVILDMVGGDYIAKNFAAAAPQARIVNIAYQKGAAATVDFRPMMQKRLTLTATTLRGRAPNEKRTIRDALLKTVWPLIASGAIKPVIDSVFPLAEAGAAHARMAVGRPFGKIVLIA
jgi:NADPH2:quinone reductase